MIHILTRDITLISDDEYRVGFYEMSPERQKKCLAYRFDDDRKRCIAADILLRDMLSQLLSCDRHSLEFGIMNGGKPYLIGNAAYFGIAHSGRYVAVGVSKTHEVGIDIERIRPVNVSLMRAFCTEKDMAFILGADENITEEKITDEQTLNRFFRVWCFKEAYFKRTGEGIAPAKMLSVSYLEHPKHEEIFDGYILTVVE